MKFKRRSNQRVILTTLFTLCDTRKDRAGFALDEILAVKILRDRKVPRNSALQALRRFEKYGIVGSFRAEQTMYKIADSLLALEYIENNENKRWLKPRGTLTPPAPVLISDQHRNHYDVQLSLEQFDRIRAECEVKKGQFTLKKKAYTLSVNGTSLKGQLFIRPYWRIPVEKALGADFIKQVESQKLKQDFAVPLDWDGKRLFVGGRPADGRPIQISHSHYKNQLDIRRNEDDKNISEALEGLTNQLDFNVRILDTLERMEQAILKMAESQSRVADALVKLTEAPKPLEQKKPYQPAPPSDKWDFSFS